MCAIQINNILGEPDDKKAAELVEELLISMNKIRLQYGNIGAQNDTIRTLFLMLRKDDVDKFSDTITSHKQALDAARNESGAYRERLRKCQEQLVEVQRERDAYAHKILVLQGRLEDATRN